MTGAGLILLACVCFLGYTQLWRRSVEVKSGQSRFRMTYLPLDARGNPYAGQYSALDRWALAHLVDWSAGKQAGSRPDIQLIGVHFDASGYLIPQLLEVQQRHEAKRLGANSSMDTETAHTWAAGRLDQSIWASYVQERDALEASYYPQIPDWLAANPPAQTILLPKGFVALSNGPSAQGQRQLGNYLATQSPQVQSAANRGAGPRAQDEWHIYSPQGEEICSGTQPWQVNWILSNTHGEWPQGQPSNRADGYFMFKAENGKLLSAWDWNGTRLPESAAMPARDMHNFSILRPRHLISYYKAQQAARSNEAVAD
jgi:hypothetical protein